MGQRRGKSTLLPVLGLMGLALWMMPAAIWGVVRPASVPFPGADNIHMVPGALLGHPFKAFLAFVVLLVMLQRLRAKPQYQYPRAPFAKARPPPQDTESIAVIGSGPAGSTFALCAELLGLPVTVYDRLASLERDESSYINFKNVGLKAIGEVSPELETALRKNPTNLSPYTPIKTAAGETMVTINDPSAILLRRNELSMIISQQCKTKVHYGAEVVGVTQTASGVTVCFEDGTKKHHSMAVMCCGSRIRKVESDLDIKPAFYKKWVLRRIKDPSLAASMPQHEQLFFGRSGQLIFTFPGEYLLISHNGAALGEMPQASMSEEFSEFTGEVGGEYQGDLRSLISNVEYYREKQYITWRCPPPKRWYSGRIMAIGDACHPMTPATGSGASMAVLDAIELAVQLSKRDWWIPEEMEEAFSTFQELRDPQIRQLWKIDYMRNGMNDIVNPIGVFFRDLVYGTVFKITTTLAKRRTLR